MAEATAAAAQAANPGMDRFNRYYNAVLAQLQQDAGPERSDSQLKNYLMRMIRPTYDQAIQQRQQQTGQANAAIDTDAASRGMGTSTWVTDAKNRQRQNEAQDVATLNSNYNITLYDSLLGLINQRDQNRLALMGGGYGDGGGGGGGGHNPPTGPTDPGYGLDITNPITPVGDLNKTKVPVENKVIPGKATYKPTSMNADWLNKRTQYTR